MARTTLADTATQRPMPYCPRHERAWVPAFATPPQGYPGHWHALPAWKVRLAVRLARESGCARQITVQTTACDCCAQQGLD